MLSFHILKSNLEKKKVLMIKGLCSATHCAANLFFSSKLLENDKEGWPDKVPNI